MSFALTSSIIAETYMIVEKNDGTIKKYDVQNVDEVIFNKVTYYQPVDLGLPSGTQWANVNVGAKTPSERGDYFAWGETSPKAIYDWSTYKFADPESSRETTKYGYYFDGKTTLDSEDDAATVNFGKGWSIPTDEQWNELQQNCELTVEVMDGKSGYKITGKNGNWIFIPNAGRAEGGYIKYLNNFSYLNNYLTKSYIQTESTCYIITEDSKGVRGYMGIASRDEGLPVRAVYVK